MLDPIHQSGGTAPSAYTSADFEAWQAYVNDRSDTPPIADLRIGDVLQERYGARPLRLLVRTGNGSMRGVAQGYVVGREGGQILYVPRFGIVTEDEEARGTLIARLADAALQRGIKRSVVCSAPASTLPCLHWSKTTVTLPVDGTSEDMFAALRRKTRHRVRKAAETADVAIGRKHLSAFHEIYAGRMLQKGLGFHGLGYFESLFDGLGERMILIAARVDQDVVGGMVFLVTASTAFYMYNGANEAGRRANANHLLMWRALSHFADRGIGSVDLGESTPEGGVHTFKTEHFRGTPRDVPYCDILCGPDSKPAAVSTMPMRLRLVLRALPWLPDKMRRRLVVRRMAYERLL